MSAGPVVFIGAAGEMSRVAITRFAAASGDQDLVLCDIRTEPLQPLIERLPPGRARARRVDLFDRAALREVIDGASLVVLGAGPYIRTSAPVIEACLAAKVPYLDFDDDVESTQEALALNDRAQGAGIPIYLGCGASPGMTNVLAVDAASRLDTVETIDVCWMMGDQRPLVGRAVIEHMMHIAAGPCLTWENARPVRHETFVETGIAPMGAGIGNTLLYETAHPEPVTLPRRYPDASRIRCLGGLHPMPYNGAARGLALAIRDEAITMDQAVEFILDLLAGRLGGLAGWRSALAGMWGQVRRREMSAAQLVRFVYDTLRDRGTPWTGGLAARVTGTKDGRPAVAIRRTPVCGPGTYLASDMAAITGTACAAFMVLALANITGRSGSLAPEDWVEPQMFYAGLERVGTPRNQIVESGY